jgi:hypothetical protein
LRRHGVCSTPDVSRTFLVMHSGGADGEQGEAEQDVGEEGERLVHCDGDAYLILACDGLWDAVTDSEAAALVGGVVGAGGGPTDVATTLR